MHHRNQSVNPYPKPSTLPNGSNVVPFWVSYVFLVRDDNILPKKELHRRVWAYPKREYRILSGAGFPPCTASLSPSSWLGTVSLKCLENPYLKDRTSGPSKSRLEMIGGLRGSQMGKATCYDCPQLPSNCQPAPPPPSPPPSFINNPTRQPVCFDLKDKASNQRASRKSRAVDT